VDRDIFDKEIGARLRQAEAPVPEGAWEAISNEIGGGAGSSGFGFMGAAAAGAVMLGSLAVYSTFFEPDRVSIAEKRTADIEQTVPQPTAAEQSALPSSGTGDPEPDEAALPVAPDGERETTPTDRTATFEPAKEVKAEPAEPAESDESNEHSSFARAENTDSNDIVPHRPSTEVLLPESIPATAVSSPASEAAKQLAVAPVQAPAEPLRASIRAENLKGYAPFEIDFEAFGNFDEVDWDFGPYGQSAEVNTRRTFDKPGTYTVMLTAYGDGGTTATDMVTIEVREGSNLVVPDSFSPNGDGINDTFKAEGVNLASYQLTVTDSRGNIVFETRNIEEPWVYNGTPGSELDTYFAIIRAEGVDGKTYKVRQSIRIIF